MPGFWCLNRLSALSRSDTGAGSRERRFRGVSIAFRLCPGRTPADAGTVRLTPCLNRLSALSRSDKGSVHFALRFWVSQSPFGSVPVGPVRSGTRAGGRGVSIAFRLCPGRTRNGNEFPEVGSAVSIAFRLCPGRTRSRRISSPTWNVSIAFRLCPGRTSGDLPEGLRCPCLNRLSALSRSDR